MGFSTQVQSNQTSGDTSGKGQSGGFQQIAQPNPNPVDGGSGNMPPSSNGMPRGKGGQQSFTYSPTSGQQSMGSPNPYPNTIGMGDNRGNQPAHFGGKGKGA